MRLSKIGLHAVRERIESAGHRLGERRRHRIGRVEHGEIGGGPPERRLDLFRFVGDYGAVVLFRSRAAYGDDDAHGDEFRGPPAFCVFELPDVLVQPGLS